ncbi:MAG: putative metal-binding motif-containing protein [Chitinophagaceae bacterium]|nr:putative metal-binding motif-containing protein [Chitinophagaceae bacterium]
MFFQTGMLLHIACTPSGYVANSSDCNDNNNLINPAAMEICNTIDDNCDTQTDENVQSVFYADSDNDNYGDLSVSTLACTPPSGYVANSSDCNDNNNLINPAAMEICNSLDDNCDTQTDENVQSAFYADSDNDNYGDLSVSTLACTPPSGFVANNSDCNDTDNLINPAAIEICNSLDDNCDTQTDENVQTTFYVDSDNDNFGDVDSTVLACTIPVGFVSDNTDCNDSDNTVNPFAVEVCNSIDDNCDTQTDENVQSVFYADSDNDNYGDLSISTLACTPPSGFVANNSDCNDSDNLINPAAIEICNSIDDNCDSQTDENVQSVFYADTDIDNFGDPDSTILACTVPMGFVSDNTDCNDSNNAINPVADEVCNTIDDDCDSQTDEEVQSVFYADTDNDGFGDSLSTTLACSLPVGYVTDQTDCDDNNSTSYPGASETCNNTDDNCNLVIDEPIQVYYYSNDTSGTPASFGLHTAVSGLSRVNGANPTEGCLTGFSSKNFSNETVFNSNLTAIEFTITPDSGKSLTANSFSVSLRRNGIGPASIRFAYSIDGGSSWTDQGSDVSIANTECGINTPATWDFNDFTSSQPVIFRVYAFNASSNTGVLQLSNLAVDGTVCASIDADADGYDQFIDCDENNSLINPGADDICNGIDDNCNTLIDEGWQVYHFTDNTSGIPQSFANHADATNLTLVNGSIIAPGCPTGFSSKNYTDTTAFHIDLPAIEFTLAADSGYRVEATSFTANIRRNGLGPANLRFAYSLDSGANWIDEGSDHIIGNSDCGQTSITQWDFADFTTTQAVTFRIYGFNASSTGGVMQLLHVNLNGSVCLIPDLDNDGYNLIADCNDSDETIHPNAGELCNGLDDDCDLVIDENSIPVTITPQGSLDLCIADSVVLETMEGQGLIYQWNLNNQAIEGATSQTFIAFSPGSYSVFVIDSNNCSNTSSSEIVFNSCKTTFLFNPSKAKFQVYPNPTDGEFVLDFDAYFSNSQSTNTTTGLIRVTNLLGQVIFEETVPLTNGRIQKELKFEPSVAGGMYVFKFILTDEDFASGEAAWSTNIILIK